MSELKIIYIEGQNHLSEEDIAGLKLTDLTNYKDIQTAEEKGVAKTFTILPFTSLSISLKSFMASIIQTTLPGVTSSPTLAKMGLPGPAWR